MADLFPDYFEKRLEMEKDRLHDAVGKEPSENSDFIYAPATAKAKCSVLINKLFHD